MKITVLNGSPKGKNSITLQTINYLEIIFPEHEFSVFHVGQMIKKYEKDATEVLDSLKEAELILFSYPVYTFIAPSQLHHFIRIMKESGIDFSGKFGTQITTSKHFYDVTAHTYIQENCEDMGIKFVKGLSADMDDLLKEKGQAEAREFFQYVDWCVKHDVCEPKRLLDTSDYKPIPVSDIADRPKKGERQVVIVADLREGDEQLQSMITHFQHVLPVKSRVINIREFPFKGGCVSCFNCASTGKCIYIDGFDTFLREEIQANDAIVYACTIEDHSMGHLFKMYDDRQFCNGHRTVTMGMPFGYLISGPYKKEFNLRMVVEGRAEVGGNFLAGVATDETDPEMEIRNLAARLTFAMQHSYVQPSNFLGVGGMKIFRDLIFVMRGLMKEDHKFYKEHGQYDFPQKQVGRVHAMYLVGAMMSSPKIQKKLGNKMNEGMMMPYDKLLNKVRKQQEEQ